jgi:hypothetical protein
MSGAPGNEVDKIPEITSEIVEAGVFALAIFDPRFEGDEDAVICNQDLSNHDRSIWPKGLRARMVALSQKDIFPE